MNHAGWRLSFCKRCDYPPELGAQLIGVRADPHTCVMLAFQIHNTLHPRIFHTLPTHPPVHTAGWKVFKHHLRGWFVFLDLHVDGDLGSAQRFWDVCRLTPAPWFLTSWGGEGFQCTRAVGANGFSVGELLMLPVSGDCKYDYENSYNKSLCGM